MSATPIMLCVGGSRAETEWGLHDLSWKGFTATLSTRMERNCGAETHAEYMALPKAEQDKRKDVGGFVGGSLRDGLRLLHRAQSDHAGYGQLRPRQHRAVGGCH